MLFDNYNKLFLFGKLELFGQARGFFLRVELGEWASIRNLFFVIIISCLFIEISLGRLQSFTK